MSVNGFGASEKANTSARSARTLDNPHLRIRHHQLVTLVRQGHLRTVFVVALAPEGDVRDHQVLALVQPLLLAVVVVEDPREVRRVRVVVVDDAEDGEGLAPVADVHRVT
jgi:hypothetical protein